MTRDVTTQRPNHRTGISNTNRLKATSNSKWSPKRASIETPNTTISVSTNNHRDRLIIESPVVNSRRSPTRRPLIGPHYTWACDNCGIQANLSLALDEYCPNCHNVRSSNCLVECFNGLSDVSLPFFNNDTNSCILGGGLGFAKRQSGCSQGGPQRPKSLEAPFDVTSVLSTRDECGGGGIFSTDKTYQGNASDTELESTVSETEDEHTLLNADEEYNDHVVKVLESRFLTAFKDHLDLAAIVIPRIYHSSARPSDGDDQFTSTPTGSNGKGKSSDSRSSQKQSSSSSGPPGQGNQKSGSHQRKRVRDSDDHGDQPRKQGFKPMKPTLDHASESFACHFHKFDPLEFNASNRETKRYRNCMDPVIPELRRIKDHFKAAHVMSQCERCNESFYEVTERITHQELGECNPNESKPLRRGINDTQWLAIEKVIGGKQKHGIEKWFEIWHILFPNIPKPLNPYKGSYKTTHPPSVSRVIDVQRGLERFRRLVEIDRENGTLRTNDPVSDRIMAAVERVLIEIRNEEMGDSSDAAAESYFSNLQIRGRDVPNMNSPQTNDSVLRSRVSQETLTPYNLDPFQSPSYLNHDYGLATHNSAGFQRQLFSGSNMTASQQILTPYNSDPSQSPYSPSYNHVIATNNPAVLHEPQISVLQNQFYATPISPALPEHDPSMRTMTPAIEPNQFYPFNQTSHTTLEPQNTPVEQMGPSYLDGVAETDLGFGVQDFNEMNELWNTDCSNWDTFK